MSSVYLCPQVSPEDHGIRSSAVFFTVVNHPQHGELVVTVGSARKDPSSGDLQFTQLDLEGEKVKGNPHLFCPDSLNTGSITN